MKLSNIKIIRGRVDHNDLGDALINPNSTLTDDTLFYTCDEKLTYLPIYEIVTEVIEGKERFNSSLSKDGELIIFLKSTPSTSIKDKVENITPSDSGVFNLVLNVNGSSTKILLKKTNINGYYKLSAKLAGLNLKVARESLYDTNPNVVIEVNQTEKIAGLQTRDFIAQMWDTDVTKNGLLNSLGKLPFGLSIDSIDSIDNLYSAIKWIDKEYCNKYLIVEATYVMQVSVPALPGFTRWSVNWKQAAYNYYQDNQNLNQVFYIPDSFKFGKGIKEGPTISLLQFSVPKNANSVKDINANFRFYGSPVVDKKRIDNATETLKQQIGETVTMISVEYANNSQRSLVLNLPNEENTGSDYKPEPNATIHFTEEENNNGLRGEVFLNFKQFSGIWTAIHSTADDNPLFRGWVDLKLSDGKFKEKINFDTRLPKDGQKALLDSIIDKHSKKGYNTKYRVGTLPIIFNKPTSFEQAENKKKQIVEIELIFLKARPNSILLNKEKLGDEFIIEQPIRDIILGIDIPDEYPYTLKVICDDGEIYEFSKKISNGSKIWITPQTIGQCSAPFK